MYEDLIQELRHGELALSTSMSRRQLMNKAANAIEILSKHDAEVDEIARQSCEVRTALGCATMDELLELARDGRLLVLPCKVGNEVYRIIDDCDYPGDCGTKMKCKGCEYRNIYAERQLFTLQMIKDIGKTVFLTREEAEAALRGGADGGAEM